MRWIDEESAGTPGVTPKHSREDNVNLPKSGNNSSISYAVVWIKLDDVCI